MVKEIKWNQIKNNHKVKVLITVQLNLQLPDWSTN